MVRPHPRLRTHRPAAINAQIVLVDGFEPLDAVAVYEVLRAGGAASGEALTVELVSVDALDPDRCDLIVVPGAADVYTAPAEHLPSSVAGALETELPVLVKHALANPDVTVAAIGGGALMLAMAGLFDGRHVATHHRSVNLLEGTGAILAPARVVDDGDLITGTGITAGVDVGLYILERELGPRIAHSVEQLLAYERRGAVWRPAGAEPVL
jgi:transcriptional regulator GlxA family with amidase domain